MVAIADETFSGAGLEGEILRKPPFLTATAVDNMSHPEFW